MDRLNRPFECYFCHQKIENDTEMGHMSICGNVLTPCPFKCGSYIPRMDLSLHKKECVNRPGRSMTRLTTTTDTLETYDDGTHSLNRRPQNHLVERLQQDLHKLNNRLASFEMSSSVGKNQDVEKMKYQNSLMLEWKKGVDFKLETLQQVVGGMEKSRGEGEYRLMGLQQRVMAVEGMKGEFDRAMDNFLEEQNYNRKANLEFAKDLNEFRDVFEHENATTATLYHDQKLIIEDIRHEIEDLKKSLEEQKAKNVSVVFDIKTISQIASETAEKFELQDKAFNNFKEELEQMKVDLEFLDHLISADAKTASPGHLIWRISDFDSKMQKAKNTNTVLKSPVFFTHDFGYKVRLLVHLNGLKKWKDRYALVSLHVLKGDFDPLLKWPCYIEGTVTLRDQENIENPKNFVKHIAAKRQTGDEENEEPQESSLSYIFIPHATLTKGQYLRNDEIFLGVKIEQNRKLLTETTL